jgi:hypothetical protein
MQSRSRVVIVLLSAQLVMSDADGVRASAVEEVAVPPMGDEKVPAPVAVAASSSLPHPDSMIDTRTCGSIEGYWANPKHSLTEFDGAVLPSPIAHPAPFPTLAPFWAKLGDLQRVIDSGKSSIGVRMSANGASRCRLCGEAVGSEEYNAAYGHIRVPEATAPTGDAHYLHRVSWPEGLLHYGLQHNVVPSKRFFDIISGLAFTVVAK